MLINLWRILTENEASWHSCCLLKFFPNFFSNVWYKKIPFWHIWINLFKFFGIIGRQREIVMQHKIFIPITRQIQERALFPSGTKSKRTIWLDWTSKNTIITSTPCQCNVLRKNNKYTLHRKRANLHLRCTYTMEIIWTHSNNRQTSKKATVDLMVLSVNHKHTQTTGSLYGVSENVPPLAELSQSK